MNDKYIIHVEDTVVCISKVGQSFTQGFYLDMLDPPNTIAQEIYELLASANLEVEFGEDIQ